MGMARGLSVLIIDPLLGHTLAATTLACHEMTAEVVGARRHQLTMWYILEENSELWSVQYHNRNG